MWPGDPDVIRLDRNLCDQREEQVERLLYLLLATIDEIAEKSPISDVPRYLDKRFAARSNVPETQTALF